MVRRISEVEKIARRVVALVEKSYPIQAAYLFGSYAAGTPHEYSDIDIAIFADGLDSVDVDERMDFIARVQKEFDEEIELHLFSTDMLKENRPSNFFGYIIANGKKIAA